MYGERKKKPHPLSNYSAQFTTTTPRGVTIHKSKGYLRRTTTFCGVSLWTTPKQFRHGKHGAWTHQNGNVVSSRGQRPAFVANRTDIVLQYWPRTTQRDRGTNQLVGYHKLPWLTDLHIYTRFSRVRRWLWRPGWGCGGGGQGEEGQEGAFLLPVERQESDLCIWRDGSPRGVWFVWLWNELEVTRFP